TWQGWRRCARRVMPQCGTTASETRRLLARREAAEHGNLLGIRAVAGSGDLEDEGQLCQPRLVEQCAKAFFPDLPGADVGVAVAIVSEPGDGIVAVDDVDILEPHHLVELADRSGDVGRRALVITGCER